MRVVLDTNIFNSAFISDKGLPAHALNLWFEGRYTLVTSTWQIEEFRRTSRYERVQTRVESPLVGRFVNLLRKYADIQETLPRVDASPDADDNNIIATGIAGAANYIVSGDKKDMVKLEKVQGIPIITARQFVELFGKPEQ